MITNLPKKLTTKFLDEFDVGSSEAVEDTLLNLCYCDIEPISDFLAGNYEILYGAKGAGKTAVLTSIRSGKIKFKNEKKMKQIVVPIDQELEYCSIKSRLDKSLNSEIEDNDARYRFLWEIYILYRISLKIKERYSNLPQDISKKLNELVGFFSGKNKTPTLFQFLTSSKRTVGFKLDSSPQGLPVPDFYLSSEPQKIVTDDSLEVVTFNLGKYKDDLSKFVRKGNSIIYVLIDQLDDFVAKEEYNEQISLIQGLVKTTRSYSNHSGIKVKLFLRTELFRSLDFSQLGGYDKIEPRSIELRWSSCDIRNFLSLRIQYNLFKTLKIKHFKCSIDEHDPLLGGRRSSGRRLFAFLKKHVPSVFGSNRDQYDSRDITIKDQIRKEIITSIFPEEVNHYSLQGKEIRSDLFKYFEGHFSLASGETTPRIMLIFLKKVIAESKGYYAGNLTVEIPLNDQNRYPLIRRDHLCSAYAQLQITMKDIFKGCITNKQWRKG